MVSWKKALLLVLFFGNQVFAENVFIGEHKVRGILNLAEDKTPRPLVILFPGSGGMGPEVQFPGFFFKPDGQKRLLTTDGNSHSIFKGFTAALNDAGVSTLAVGKPGVDYSTDGVYPAPYYDQELFKSLTWSDWVKVARESVIFARSLPGVDPRRVYVLGHSESTQMVVDYAKTDADLGGVILFGVLNDNFATEDAYQIFELEVDTFFSPTVDANNDGFIDRQEAALWPEDFKWTWLKGQEKVSLGEIKAARKADPILQKKLKDRRIKFRDAVYDRPMTLADILIPLKLPIFVFTGELDVMTVPSQAEAIKKSCHKASRANCSVQIVPGVGHGFSPPIGPRAQPYLDWSMGPVSPSFQRELKDLARCL